MSLTTGILTFCYFLVYIKIAQLFLQKLLNLIKASNDIVNNGGKTPKIKCVICGLANAIYQREDGVFVVPITALKN